MVRRGAKADSQVVRAFVSNAEGGSSIKINIEDVQEEPHSQNIA